VPLHAGTATGPAADVRATLQLLLALEPALAELRRTIPSKAPRQLREAIHNSERLLMRALFQLEATEEEP
jgi:hypothetical protein